MRHLPEYDLFGEHHHSSVRDSLESNATPGFFLRRLVVTGPTVPQAELTFAPGLNLVSGPSNTGKSFAFHLLDYLLGSSRLRKMVNEARSYDYAWLEIETYAGAVHTIARSLTHSGIRWYDLPFVEINPASAWESLRLRRNKKNADTLSARLLQICGVSGRVIKRKQREIQPLSFRNIADFVLVDELRIITDGSPVVGANRVENPAERSTFQLLLSGEDASSFPTGEDPADSRRKILAQLEFLGQLIDALPVLSDNDPDVLRAGQVGLNELISELTAFTVETAAVVDSTSAAMETIERDLRTERSKLIVNLELSQRFELLRDSYLSDLQRLNFLGDGASAFSMLPSVPCPLCGAEIISPEVSEAASEEPPLGAQIYESCLAEEHKIRIHLRGLEEAIQTLTDEAVQINTTIGQLNGEAGTLRSELTERLHPQQFDMLAKLQELVATQKEATSLLIAIEQRKALIQRRMELQGALAKVPKQRLPKGSIQVETTDLEVIIRELLEAWRYPELGKVEYDLKTDDLIVAGQPRNSQGKGVRAIVYSAFVIALMRLSRRTRTGHPGLVILDSPLTTYRRPDVADDLSPAMLDEVDEVSPDMQSAFFGNLALHYDFADTRPEEQVIIFENKEPPSDFVRDMQFIRFVGPSAPGRSGFLPRAH